MNEMLLNEMLDDNEPREHREGELGVLQEIRLHDHDTGKSLIFDFQLHNEVSIIHEEWTHTRGGLWCHPFIVSLDEAERVANDLLEFVARRRSRNERLKVEPPKGAEA